MSHVSGCAEAIVSAVTLKQKLQIKLAVSPGLGTLIQDQPVQALTLRRQTSCREANIQGINFSVTSMTHPGRVRLIIIRLTINRFIIIKSANRDFLHSPQCAANRLQHVRNRVQITCNTSSAYHVHHVLRATWYEGIAQLLSSSELKSHLFELYFIG